jgi:hypothetical protein
MENKNKKPIIYLILKIIGIIGLIIGIYGFFLSISGFGDFSSNDFMKGGTMATVGCFIGFACLMTGFTPEFAKLKNKTSKYIQELNEDLTIDKENQNNDESSDTKTKHSKYCKHCGAKLITDKCDYCGK